MDNPYTPPSISETSSSVRSSPLEVSATYGLPMLARRWAALWIDFLILAGFLVVTQEAFGLNHTQLINVAWPVLFCVYFSLLEGIFGNTLGKLILRIAVVDSNGLPPGIPRALLRTIARIIDTNPVLFGGLPGAIAFGLSKHHQRLGDMLAKTYVILVRDRT